MSTVCYASLKLVIYEHAQLADGDDESFMMDMNSNAATAAHG